MNILKALFLGFCALAIVSCSDDEDTTGPDTSSPAEHTFVSKQGDYSTYDVYRLDENNATLATTATYSSRTVLMTNMSFQGKTGVTMVVDSLFEAGSSTVERVDTVYYTVENNGLFIYNFAETFISFIPPEFPLQLEPVAGWVKVADLKESSSSFTSTLKVKATGFGELTVTITGSNKGKQVVDGYTVFHNEMTASSTVPIVNIKVEIPIVLDLGGVKNATNSPSTMVKLQINKFTEPSSNSVVTGRSQTLATFRAGS